MRVTDGATVELTSSLAELNLVNVRFVLRSASSLVVSAANIQWQSEETNDDRSGAALNVNSGCTATFKEAVTFTGCTIVSYPWADKGGAVSNQGDLEFLGDVVIIGTTEGGGLYNTGTVTFHGDATFEDNHNANNYNDGGGGLFTEDGLVTFKGAASFIGNEVVEFLDYASEGKLFFGGEGGGLHVDVSDDDVGVIFEGPVLFSGNTAKEGGGMYASSGMVIFEDLVTFEDNMATSVGDTSGGGGMTVYSGNVDFQAGVTATGNIAKNGGAFKIRDEDGVIKMEGPVTITANEARYQGGAFWNRGNVSLPQDADISGNTAVFCPGIKNYEDWERSSPEYTRRYSDPSGLVEFSDGSSYYGSDIAICYFGEDVGNGADTAVTIDSDATDCDALFGEGKTLGGYSVLTWDTRLISAVNLVGGSSGFDVSCTNHSIIFVTGGGEVTVTSTADTSTFSNIRFEVGGYSNLYFDVPELIMTGIENSPIGGSTHVDKGSSLEFWWDVKFLSNTLFYLTDSSWFVGKTKFWYNFNLGGGNGGGIANGGQIWFNKRTVWRNNLVEWKNAEEGSSIYGGHGAALYNYGPFGTTEFYSKAYFRDNVGGFRGGAVAADGEGGDESTEVTNKITFGHKTTFKDNSFDVDRPDTGGAGLWVYQGASVEFQDKVVFRRNLAINGAAIMNGGGYVNFSSADIINMIDNVATESCPDIKNYDKGSFYNRDLFGDIDDPEGECGSSSDLCTWFEGTVTIGSADPIVGETSDICEF
eukprot:jgi/Undpi1/5196/HiC_scaffold_2.g00478.m2